MDDQGIIGSYEVLYEFDNKELPNDCEFKKNQMKGYMRKKGQKASMFMGEQYMKRYFIAHFGQAWIKIMHTPADTDNIQKLQFGDIVSITEFTSKEDAKVSCKYKFGFLVQAKSRQYELYCKTAEERKAWLAAFNYLVLSTQKVQQIMTRNDQKIDKELRRSASRLNSSRKSPVRKLKPTSRARLESESDMVNHDDLNSSKAIDTSKTEVRKLPPKPKQKPKGCIFEVQSRN